MARTTVDIDDPILREVKRLQKQEGKPLGRLISDLLATGLSTLKKKPTPKTEFHWLSQDMGAPRVDLRDKDAVWAALDQGDRDDTA